MSRAVHRVQNKADLVSFLHFTLHVVVNDPLRFAPIVTLHVHGTHYLGNKNKDGGAVLPSKVSLPLYGGGGCVGGSEEGELIIENPGP